MAHPQGAALFLEVINHVLLLLVDPTGERDEHESERGASNHGTQATGRWYLGVTWRPIQESTLAKQHQFERRSNFGQNDVVSRDGRLRATLVMYVLSDGWTSLTL